MIVVIFVYLLKIHSVIYQHIVSFRFFLRNISSWVEYYELFIDLSHKTRHRSGVHHRIHSYSVKTHSHSRFDKVNEPNRWIANGFNEITMENAPSREEISAIEHKHRHLSSSPIPQVYDGKSTDVEALIHQHGVKLYEIHEIDGKFAHIRHVLYGYSKK